jgi:hypothetical protein
VLLLLLEVRSVSVFVRQLRHIPLHVHRGLVQEQRRQRALT